MTEHERKIGILGIGNLLLGDEGFGVHVIRFLEENFVFPEQVRLLDGGTAGIYMAPFLEDVDHLIVIDVVAVEGVPGSLHCFNGTELRGASLQLRMSPHQLGLLEILEISRLRERAPSRVHFFGVVPERVETRMELSPTLQAKVAEVTEKLLGMLAEEGVYARTIAGPGAHPSAC